MNEELRLNKVDEIKSFLIEEKNRNELMSKKHKKVWIRILNYVDHLLILIYTIIGCFLISAFASLVGIPMGITTSAIGLKTFVITAVIKKYKSINKTKKRNIKR